MASKQVHSVWNDEMIHAVAQWWSNVCNQPVTSDWEPTIRATLQCILEAAPPALAQACCTAYRLGGGLQGHVYAVLDKDGKPAVCKRALEAQGSKAEYRVGLLPELSLAMLAVLKNQPNFPAHTRRMLDGLVVAKGAKVVINEHFTQLHTLYSRSDGDTFEFVQHGGWDAEGNPVGGWHSHMHVSGCCFIPLDTLVHMVYQLTSHVAALHACGLSHTDIKPENVLYVMVRGRVILYLGDVDSLQLLDSNGTIGRGCIHTRGFASPERSSGQVSGPSDDVFSVGTTCLAWFLGYGHLSHDEDRYNRFWREAKASSHPLWQLLLTAGNPSMLPARLAELEAQPVWQAAGKDLLMLLARMMAVDGTQHVTAHQAAVELQDIRSALYQRQLSGEDNVLVLKQQVLGLGAAEATPPTSLASTSSSQTHPAAPVLVLPQPLPLLTTITLTQESVSKASTVNEAAVQDVVDAISSPRSADAAPEAVPEPPKQATCAHVPHTSTATSTISTNPIITSPASTTIPPVVPSSTSTTLPPHVAAATAPTQPSVPSQRAPGAAAGWKAKLKAGLQLGGQLCKRALVSTFEAVEEMVLAHMGDAVSFCDAECTAGDVQECYEDVACRERQEVIVE